MRIHSSDTEDISILRAKYIYQNILNLRAAQKTKVKKQLKIPSYLCEVVLRAENSKVEHYCMKKN